MYIIFKHHTTSYKGFEHPWIPSDNGNGVFALRKEGQSSYPDSLPSHPLSLPLFSAIGL